jgi:hypothetical protein
MKTGNAYKRMLVQAYNRYAKYHKITWEDEYNKLKTAVQEMKNQLNLLPF